MTLTQPPETWRETVLKEWTDYNGHMNLSYYVLIFDHATDALYPLVGLDDAYRTRSGCSTFTVESHITYPAEVLQGDEVYCTTQLLGFDDKRLHYFHRMYHADKNYLAATTELMAVHVDLNARRVVPMPERIQNNLTDMLAAHSSLPRPDEMGRVMGVKKKSGG